MWGTEDGAGERASERKETLAATEPFDADEREALLAEERVALRMINAALCDAGPSEARTERRSDVPTPLPTLPTQQQLRLSLARRRWRAQQRRTPQELPPRRRHRRRSHESWRDWWLSCGVATLAFVVWMGLVCAALVVSARWMLQLPSNVTLLQAVGNPKLAGLAVPVAIPRPA